MNCQFDLSLAERYRSPSQMIRVLTEAWTGTNIFCPRCGHPSLRHFPNNQAVADFFCPLCRSEYELKSVKGKVRGKIPDGEYHTFIQRITSNNNPDFFLLSYDARDMCVNNFWVIPKYFFVPAIVEARNPLSENARRSGWVGCNILIGKIPEQGRIGIVNDRQAAAKEAVMEKVRRSMMLRTNDMEARGWLLDVLNCVNAIDKDPFSLSDVYRFEAALRAGHPQNNNIRAKIRQQMQLLRDKGFVDFLGRGIYKKREP